MLPREGMQQQPDCVLGLLAAGVAIHCCFRERPTDQACVRPGKSDGRTRENIALERSTRADCRGGADLPEHVTLLPAVNHGYRGGAGCDAGPDLEDPDRVAVATRVERQSARG